MTDTYISKREWIITLLIAFMVVSATNIPYIIGCLNSSPEKIYIGSRPNNSRDYPTYLAWIEQGRHGLLSKILYSSESQNHLFFHPLFFVVGQTAKMAHLSNSEAYHVFRNILSLCLLLSGYRLIAIFIRHPKERMLAFLFFGCAGGIGWIGGTNAVDMVNSEATNFLSIYESLLYPASLTLLIWIFILYLDSSQLPLKPSRLGKLFILFSLLILIHPYDIIIILSILAGVTIYQMATEKNQYVINLYSWILLLCAPAIGYELYVITNNPIIGLWATVQTQVAANTVGAYIASYGALCLLSIIALILGRIKREKHIALLGIWLLMNICLLFNPFSNRFQQKLSASIFIPLSILSAYTLCWAANEAQKSIRIKIVYLIYIVALTPFVYTNIYIIRNDVTAINSKTETLYINSSENGAMRWLRENAGSTDIILSGQRLGNLIPAYAGKIVYLGHYDQTFNLNTKYETMARALTTNQKYSDPLLAFLRMNNISYVVADSELSSLNIVNLSNHSYLIPKFHSPSVTIYAVK